MVYIEQINNSHAEAANQRIKYVEIEMVHTTLWPFITCLRKIQAGRLEPGLFKLESGRSPPQKKSKIY